MARRPHAAATGENRLYTLHRDLLYPAFLGAVLFEAFRKTTGDVAHHKLDWLWLCATLWFVLYFSVAFLGLVETDRRKFGYNAFFANLLEIAVILLAGVSTQLVEADTGLSKYTGVYVAWIVIPISAAWSNYFSGRTVRTALSIAAILVGTGGLVWARNSDDGFSALLLAMYLLLFLYYVTVFRRRSPFNYFNCDIAPYN